MLLFGRHRTDLRWRFFKGDGDLFLGRAVALQKFGDVVAQPVLLGRTGPVGMVDQLGDRGRAKLTWAANWLCDSARSVMICLSFRTCFIDPSYAARTICTIGDWGGRHGCTQRLSSRVNGVSRDAVRIQDLQAGVVIGDQSANSCLSCLAAWMCDNGAVALPARPGRDRDRDAAWWRVHAPAPDRCGRRGRFARRRRQCRRAPPASVSVEVPVAISSRALALVCAGVSV